MNLKDLGRALHKNPPLCKCGADMILRVQNHSPNQSDLFWGCTNWHDKSIWPKHDSLPFHWQATAGNFLEALKGMKL